MTPFKRRLISTFSVLILFATPLFSQEPPAAPNAKDKLRILEYIGKTLKKKAFSAGADFDRWDEYLRLHQAEIDRSQTREAFILAVNATLGEFQISHLKLIPPTRKTTRFHRPGLFTQPLDGTLLVTFADTQGPAYDAGIRNGDQVLTVDGQAMASPEGLPTDPEREFLFAWSRQDTEHEAHIRPEDFEPDRPESKWLKNKVLWIRIPSFGGRQYKVPYVEAAFRKADTAELVIIDLRSNPGGRLGYVDHLLSKVFPQKSLLYSLVHQHHFAKAKKRKGKESSLSDLLEDSGIKVTAWGNRSPYLGKLAVLVDANAYSGAELFAAIIKDMERGLIVGTATTGYVLPSVTFLTPKEFILRIPKGEILTSRGTRLEANPIMPHVVLKPEETANDDRVFSHAINAAHGNEP